MENGVETKILVLGMLIAFEILPVIFQLFSQEQNVNFKLSSSGLGDYETCSGGGQHGHHETFNGSIWDFPGGQGVKTLLSNAGGRDSIPGQGAKIT